MRHVIYYANGGSGNHGCEAISRSLIKIIGPSYRHSVFSQSVAEDHRYGLDELAEIIDINDCKKDNWRYLKSYCQLKFMGRRYALDIYPYKEALDKIEVGENLVALSIGGDNYCYGGTDYYRELNATYHSCGIRTVMVGCSIEPDVISSDSVKKDLARHELIIARESLTFNALKANGLNNVCLLPDPAFQLNTRLSELPDGFETGNTVGINLSPLVEEFGTGNNIVLRNIVKLIEHIIKTTKYQIALIPHVVWAHTNDLSILDVICEKFKSSNRVILLPDAPAEVLKGYISRCRFMIAARTHASIAAYSTCVPTIVIGYSVKADGIAKDIFGTADNYVIRTQHIDDDNELTEAFQWLKEHENPIRSHLAAIMPDYCNKAGQIAVMLESMN